MSALLEVRGLGVELASRRGAVLALENVSFSLQSGEILGMVGESGAGKSLTGASITGLLPPSGRMVSGEVWFAGRRIDPQNDQAMRQVRGRQIGAIFQDPLTALNPLMSIGKQLVQTLQTHFPLDGERARQRAVALLAQTGVPAPELRLRQYPHQLSGGLRQRVVMALALAAEPQLLIADEPTTALDVSVQAQVMAMIKQLARERGLAVLLITHDMGVVAELCDRVAVVYAGRIVEMGPVTQVLHQPAHPYTAGLMGAIPEVGSHRARLVQIAGAMPRPADRPAGCAFHPRCGAARPNCAIDLPELRPLRALDGDRELACWWPLVPADGGGL